MYMIIFPSKINDQENIKIITDKFKTFVKYCEQS